MQRISFKVLPNLTHFSNQLHADPFRCDKLYRPSTKYNQIKAGPFDIKSGSVQDFAGENTAHSGSGRVSFNRDNWQAEQQGFFAENAQKTGATVNNNMPCVCVCVCCNHLCQQLDWL